MEIGAVVSVPPDSGKQVGANYRNAANRFVRKPYLDPIDAELVEYSLNVHAVVALPLGKAQLLMELLRQEVSLLPRWPAIGVQRFVATEGIQGAVRWA